jgi:hypothetical protein
MLFRIFGQGCCFPHHLLDSKPSEDFRRRVRAKRQHQPDERPAGKVKTLEKRNPRARQMLLLKDSALCPLMLDRRGNRLSLPREDMDM